ncbi:VWA domain-containing protein [Acidobacteria bacterium AB60]|nr:VWA domain-containing protein [Acidobacteria bacterium AB60]
MRSRAAFGLLWVLVCCPGVEGQAKSGEQPPAVRTTTRAVVVDVVATKGEEAVTGLRKDDFVVLEDGKPQTVNFFEEHTAKTLPPGAAAALPKMPAGVYTNVPPAPPSDAVNVLLLDALNTDREDQSYVRNQLVKFLKTMTPGTRAAIFTLGSKLRMVQGFTADATELQTAMNDPKYGIVPEKPHEARSVQDQYDDLDDVKRMLTLTGGRMTQGIEAMRAFQRESANVNGYERAGMTLEALQGLARYLAAVPGRKNLIWFSSSFPVAVFPRVGQSQQPDQFNTTDLRTYGKEVRKTADLLTISKVAVYPVGAEGMMSEHVFEANVDGPTDYVGQTLNGPRSGRMDPYTNENGMRADKISTMEQLAADTGGKAYFNTNDLNGAMQKAITDGSHYYTLAYTPTNRKMDGSYRRIEVKVKDAKYRLAYRRGYNADELPPVADAKANANPLHALLTPGMPEATEILFAARVAPETPQPAAGSPRAGKNAKLTGPTRRYAIDFMIRWTDVKLEAQADGTRAGKLQVELLAFDREGNAVNWGGGTEAMNLKPEVFAAIEKSGVPAHAEIDLPADKDVVLEAGVYDWATGKAGTMRVALPAQAEEKAGR